MHSRSAMWAIGSQEIARWRGRVRAPRPVQRTARPRSDGSARRLSARRSSPMCRSTSRGRPATPWPRSVRYRSRPGRRRAGLARSAALVWVPSMRTISSSWVRPRSRRASARSRYAVLGYEHPATGVGHDVLRLLDREGRVDRKRNGTEVAGGRVGKMELWAGWTATERPCRHGAPQRRAGPRRRRGRGRRLPPSPGTRRRRPRAGAGCMSVPRSRCGERVADGLSLFDRDCA